MGDQTPVIPLSITGGEIRNVLLKFAQAMISQDNVVTFQIQVVTKLVNREVGPLVPRHDSTMASCLMNLLGFLQVKGE